MKKNALEFLGYVFVAVLSVAMMSAGIVFTIIFICCTFAMGFEISNKIMKLWMP